MAAAGQDRESRRERNARVGLILGGVVCLMVVLAFASVPLYRLFCQVTGFDGTTQRAEAAPAEVTSDREIVVRFDATMHPGLPWYFQPETRAVKVKVGEQGLVFYKAKNLSDKRTTGQAMYNVSPDEVGAYFTKVQCFCFNEQTLEPGQEVDMAVTFFIDPAFLDDRNMNGVKTITLSYTFFAEDNPVTDGPSTDREGATRAAAPAAKQ